MREIKKIGVIGAGLMGSGIAQVAAQAGFEVVMRDINDKFIERGFEAIKKSLRLSLEKGKMTQGQAEEILGRIKGTLSLGETGKDADIIIEAAPENLELKKNLFRELDEICPAKTIFATNTSSLTITEISTTTQRPDRVIGMHFASPVPVMRGVVTPLAPPGTPKGPC